MPIPRIIANPLLKCLSACLHASPIKTRLGGISTVTAKVFGLRSFAEERTATLRNGIKMPIRLSDYNGRMLYLFGTPDPKVVSVCQELLNPGDVFLDIGANYGTVGLLSHEAIGAQGAMHFVEPQPELCKVIEASIDSVPIPNAHVHNCGMWDEDGELTLSRPDKHTGAASLAKTSEGGDSFQVPVRAVDSFLSEVVGDRPFGAKVDVEGAEPKILPAILAHPSLRFVLFECNIPEVRDHAWELIEAKKLVFFGLSKHLFRTRIRAIHSLEELRQVHDVLAVQMDASSVPVGEIHPRKLAELLS